MHFQCTVVKRYSGWMDVGSALAAAAKHACNFKTLDSRDQKETVIFHIGMPIAWILKWSKGSNSLNSYVGYNLLEGDEKKE